MEFRGLYPNSFQFRKNDYTKGNIKQILLPMTGKMQVILRILEYYGTGQSISFQGDQIL